MADQNQLLAEAYRRGLLPPERKAAYEEAVRRGLIAGQSAPKAPVAKPAPQPKKLRWSDVPGEALENLPESAKEFGKAIVQPLVDPVGTAAAVNDLLSGAGRKVARAIGTEKLGNAMQDIVTPKRYEGAVRKMRAKQEDTAAATGDYLKARYGGVENLKRTMAKDPVGFLADASTVLTAGGGAAARAPGVVGKVARAAEKTGRAIDPLAVAAKGAGATGKVAGEAGAALLGVTTGAGPMAVKEAAKAGVRGGKRGKAFREHMRGEAPTDEIVTEAKKAVGAMRAERGEQYRADIAETKSDPAQLQFDNIEAALQGVKDRGEFKGKRIDPTAAKAWDQIDSLVQDWKAADPAEFHTPEGIDALKKAIGNVRDSLEYNTPARNAADAAYRAVRGTITEQVPSYSKAMRGYERASEMIGDVEKSLSLGNRVGLDTSSRKLQSIMRNNANTDYGRRAELGDLLEKYGAETLVPSIAGQALSSATPRAFGGALTGAGSLGLMQVLGPKALVGLAAASPRLVGEVVHGASRVASPVVRGVDELAQRYGQVQPTLMAAQQVGRVGQGPEGLREMVDRYGQAPPEETPAPAEPVPEEPQTEEVSAPEGDLTFDEFADRVMMAESGGDPNAVSPVGAVGTMQTMPGTLRDPGYDVAPAADDSDAERERVGTDYLKAMLDKYEGDAIRALVAYNWGPANADEWISGGEDPSGLPEETLNYVKKITGIDLEVQD
ncbi:hypothetical protein [Caulobacter phage KcrB]|nr:hypothetical protein RW_GP063c [Caulobacter phage RW]WCA46367.1 hypothetical protein [Caulobacter phage KcrB]WCD56302.1 hypothetical protein [Caulobacter phage RLK]